MRNFMPSQLILWSIEVIIILHVHVPKSFILHYLLKIATEYNENVTYSFQIIVSVNFEHL